jgi:hypothetical protein
MRLTWPLTCIFVVLALLTTGRPRGKPNCPLTLPRTQRITPGPPVPTTQQHPGVEPGATQTTSGALSHPHSKITTDPPYEVRIKIPSR